MNEKNKINSHEYISKTVLKNFSFSQGRRRYANYIKLPYGKLHYGDIEKFNTRKGAYTKENEDIMRDEFENYLGDTEAKARKNIKKYSILNRSDFDISRIRKYFAYQCIRDDISVSNILNVKNTLFGYKYKKVPDDVLHVVKNYFIEKEYEDGSSFVSNLSKYGHDTLGLALSPQIIFILTKDYSCNIELKYTHFAWRVLSKLEVGEINALTRRTGMDRRCGYIISKDRELLVG